MEQVKEFILHAWEWLNQPLPIVGVSVLFILIFLWKFLASTSFGKKQIKKLNEGFERTKQKLEDEIKHYQDVIAQQNEKIKFLESLIGELILLIPNKKVNALWGKYYGEEKVDSKTEKE